MWPAHTSKTNIANLPPPPQEKISNIFSSSAATLLLVYVCTSFTRNKWLWSSAGIALLISNIMKVHITLGIHLKPEKISNIFSTNAATLQLGRLCTSLGHNKRLISKAPIQRFIQRYLDFLDQTFTNCLFFLMLKAIIHYRYPEREGKLVPKVL